MKIMAVDLGHARTGIAISDIGERLASPVGTITEYVDERLLVKLTDAAKEQRAEMIVVGHPRNMDGSRGEAAKRAEDLKGQIEAEEFRLRAAQENTASFVEKMRALYTEQVQFLAKLEELTEEEKETGVFTREIPADAANFKVYFENKYGVWTHTMIRIQK